MTKYILQSGSLGNARDKGKAFYNEVIEGLGKNPRILYCLFALPRERWDKFFVYKEGFRGQISDDIKPDFELAMPETFEEQIKNCDVVMIQGGDDHLLQYWLRQFDIPKIWNLEGEVIVGSSAGSDALSNSFWTADWKKCMDGLGIVPVKFIPHYKSSYGTDDPRGLIDWDKAHKELENYGDKSLPIYALEEGKFAVFNL